MPPFTPTHMIPRKHHRCPGESRDPSGRRTSRLRERIMAARIADRQSVAGAWVPACAGTARAGRQYFPDFEESEPEGLLRLKVEFCCRFAADCAMVNPRDKLRLCKAAPPGG